MYSAANTFSREISRHYDSFFEGKGLTTSYVELMIILLGTESISQKEIAEKMNMAPSTITRFIAKLQKLGYVKKKRDGKTMSLTLVDSKKKDVKELQVLYKKADTELLDILGEKFIETTGKLLEYGSNQIRKE